MPGMDRQAVVLADEQDRQPTQAGVVDALPEDAFVGGPVAEEHGDACGVSPVERREGEPQCQCEGSGALSVTVNRVHGNA